MLTGDSENTGENIAELRESQRIRYGFDALTAKSAAMRRAVEQLRLAAGSFVPATIVSEPGGESDLFARIVHHQSAVSAGSFAIVDAAVLQPELLETRFAELTALQTEDAGAAPSRRFQTIVVIAPSRLERALQRSLADLAQDRTGRPRLIAIDEQSPKIRQRAGEMISDLANALSTLEIEVPPLRERVEDLSELVVGILLQLDDASKASSPTVDPSMMAALAAYSWPGNIDELHAVLATALKRATTAVLTAKDFPKRILRAEDMVESEPSVRPPPLDKLLAEVESRMIRLALDRFAGNKSKAAEFLGISRARMIRAAGELTSP